MAASPHNRAFQAYNSHNFQNRPDNKKTPIASIGESLVFGRIPYSSIKTTVETAPSTPTSPGLTSILKPTPVIPKRRSSTASIGQLLPRRKSLQMTALASQRQTLWISIAKNAQTNNTQSTQFPFRQPQEQPNLLRKKLLRLLLVFSYLLSISLFAIALATFYGFFWTGHSATQMSIIKTTISSTLNSTFSDTALSLENDLVIKT